MPWYDYQCAKCNSTFEVQRSFGDTAKVRCPECGSVRTLKVFSPASVQFKGSGFYVTDSHKSKNPAQGPPSTNGNATAATKDKTPPASPAPQPDSPAETERKSA